MIRKVMNTKNSRYISFCCTAAVSLQIPRFVIPGNGNCVLSWPLLPFPAPYTANKKYGSSDVTSPNEGINPAPTVCNTSAKCADAPSQQSLASAYTPNATPTPFPATFVPGLRSASASAAKGTHHLERQARKRGGQEGLVAGGIA